MTDDTYNDALDTVLAKFAALSVTDMLPLLRKDLSLRTRTIKNDAAQKALLEERASRSDGRERTYYVYFLAWRGEYYSDRVIHEIVGLSDIDTFFSAFKAEYLSAAYDEGETVAKKLKHVRNMLARDKWAEVQYRTPWSPHHKDNEGEFFASAFIYTDEDKARTAFSVIAASARKIVSLDWQDA